jgi:hypothetical protein
MRIPRLLAAALVAASGLHAGVLRDIVAPRATATPAPVATPSPTATPTPYGWTEEDARAKAERDRAAGGFWWTLLGLAATSPYWGPAAAAHDAYNDHRFPSPPLPRPRPYAVQVMAGAGWPSSVHDGSALLRLSWMRWELEAAWQRLQERADHGGQDELNQYQGALGWRFVSTPRWRGHSGLGLGTMTPLNSGRADYGGVHFYYELEYQPGALLLRVREELGGLGPLLYSSSKASLGWQWGPLELFAGWQYRDYSGVGLSGPLAGGMGTF